MGENDALPNRREIRGSSSPWVDRVTLAGIALIAILSAPHISAMLEDLIGSTSVWATYCGLLLVVPIISTYIGKRIARILSH
ncbi:MAG TPA: hypothetical protein QF703_00895 [Candidatus Thalassarchaeaceae archaeon]|nr:hypothetical protein [Candidatus Thalassarchaeaceae archaeon]